MKKRSIREVIAHLEAYARGRTAQRPHAESHLKPHRQEDLCGRRHRREIPPPGAPKIWLRSRAGAVGAATVAAAHSIAASASRCRWLLSLTHSSA